MISKPIHLKRPKGQQSATRQGLFFFLQTALRENFCLNRLTKKNENMFIFALAPSVLSLPVCLTRPIR